MFCTKKLSREKEDLIKRIPIIFDYREESNVTKELFQEDVILTTEQEFLAALCAGYKNLNEEEKVSGKVILVLHLSEENKVIGISYESRNLWSEYSIGDLFDDLHYRMMNQIGSQKIVIGVSHMFEKEIAFDIAAAFIMKSKSDDYDLLDFFLFPKNENGISLRTKGIMQF